MSKVLSLTASEVGALMNLLEAPEVCKDDPEHADLGKIYEKLTKEKSAKPSKNFTANGSGITVTLLGSSADAPED